MRQMIEIPGIGAVAAEAVLLVSAKTKGTKEAPASYDVALQGLTVKVAERDMPREQLLKELRGDYVPAAERKDTGGVRLAGGGTTGGQG